MAVRTPSPPPAVPDPQETVRVVLWFANDVPALMKMAPIDESNQLSVSSLDWVIEACGGDSAFWCEIWTLQKANWEVYALGDPKVPVVDPRAAVLMRVGGVGRCINFGVEVDMLNQHFSTGFKKSLQSDFPRLFSEYAAWAQVIIWTENGVKPAIYHLPLEPDGSLRLTSHGVVRALWTHPNEPEGDIVLNYIDVWTPEETEWTPRHVEAAFTLLPVHRTLLIKNADTWCTLELGDVLARLDQVARAGLAHLTPATPNVNIVPQTPSRGMLVSSGGKSHMTVGDIRPDEISAARNSPVAKSYGREFSRFSASSTSDLVTEAEPREGRANLEMDSTADGARKRARSLELGPASEGVAKRKRRSARMSTGGVRPRP